MPARQLLPLTMAALIGLSAGAAAQTPRLIDPLDAKDVAKAEFALAQQSATSLARAKMAFAEMQATARLKEFMAGKTTVDFLLQAQTTLMDARMTLAASQADKDTALQEYWEATWVCYQISKAKYEAGSIPITQFAQVGAQLKDAEERLVKLRGK